MFGLRWRTARGNIEEENGESARSFGQLKMTSVSSYPLVTMIFTTLLSHITHTGGFAVYLYINFLAQPQWSFLVQIFAKVITLPADMLYKHGVRTGNGNGIRNPRTQSLRRTFSVRPYSERPRPTAIRLKHL